MYVLSKNCDFRIKLLCWMNNRYLSSGNWSDVLEKGLYSPSMQTGRNFQLEWKRKKCSNHLLHCTCPIPAHSCRELVPSSRSSELLVLLPIDPTYCFHLHLCYSQLISVDVSEEENGGTVYSVIWTFYLYFVARKDESVMVTLALCKHPHRQHANATVANNPEWTSTAALQPDSEL